MIVSTKGRNALKLMMCLAQVDDHSYTPVEESIEPVKCIENGTPICETADSCHTLPIWKGLSALINNYLNSITLADAVNYKDEEGEDVT